MKAIGARAWTSLLFLLLVGAGCAPVPRLGEILSGTDAGSSKLSVYADYAPVKLEILPLTEIAGVADAGGASNINVFVSLLDSFGYQTKTPGVFRFELYEHVECSSEPKGKRVVIWPDIGLNDAVENNNYWRDFLRAYEFNLDFEPLGSESYVLQVTCLCPDGKRLSADFEL